VYSGRSESLVGGMVEDFETASGLEVDVRWGESGELAATLLEEGAATDADVFLAQDPGALGAVETMLSPLADELVAGVPAAVRPAAGAWVPLTGRARVIVYNTEAVEEGGLPEGLDDLVDPAWSGRVGWAPTNASFQAMVTAMRALWGDERTTSWLTGMLANDVSEYDGNAPIVAAVGSGEIDVGLVNHYYLYRFLAEEGPDFPVRNHFLQDGGPGSLVLMSGAGILATADNRDGAEQFIRYMLSDAVQERFVADTNEYPVVTGVASPPDLPALVDLGGPSIEVEELADVAGTVALMRTAGALP
jgi:iron(III) transport system substrate-binding protein